MRFFSCLIMSRFKKQHTIQQCFELCATILFDNNHIHLAFQQYHRKIQIAVDCCLCNKSWSTTINFPCYIPFNPIDSVDKHILTSVVHGGVKNYVYECRSNIMALLPDACNHVQKKASYKISKLPSFLFLEYRWM